MVLEMDGERDHAYAISINFCAQIVNVINPTKLIWNSTIKMLDVCAVVVIVQKGKEL